MNLADCSGEAMPSPTEIAMLGILIFNFYKSKTTHTPIPSFFAIIHHVSLLRLPIVSFLGFQYLSLIAFNSKLILSSATDRFSAYLEGLTISSQQDIITPVRSVVGII